MKRVLIIGATSAIAIATARRFAAEGAQIVLAGRHPDRVAAVQSDLVARGAKEVKSILGDLSDTSLHPRFCEQALSAFGGLDVVLLAYGVLGSQEACNTDFAAAHEVLKVNLVSPISWLTILAEAFRQKGSGSIAVIGSVAGDRGRKSNYLYGTAKGGLERFLQGLRNRLFSSGVRVITIKPGFVDTPMTKDFPKGPLFASAETVGDVIFRAISGKGLVGKCDVVYAPWFWCFIMLVIKHIPEALFKRLSI